MDIISIIAGLLKDTKSLIEFEEQVKILMQKVFTQWVGDVFEKLDQTIRLKKQAEGGQYCRSDYRSVQFLFGSVNFKAACTPVNRRKARISFPAFKPFIGNGAFKQNIRAFVLSLVCGGLIVDAREIYETPAGKAGQERPRSEVRARRLAGRPRKASEFRAHQHPRYQSIRKCTKRVSWNPDI